MRNTASYSVISVLFGLTLGACGGVDGAHDFEGAEGPSEGGAAESAIQSGKVAGGYGAVEIIIEAPGQEAATCSGVIINPHAGLTASHCFRRSALGTATTGTVRAVVSYTENGTAWQCLTGPDTFADGKCRYWATLHVNRLRATTNAEHDLAVFVFPGAGGAGFANFTDWRGIYVNPNVNLHYSFWGRGVGSNNGGGAGVMRTFNDKIDWVGDRHFFTEPGGSRTCQGDSGGPYLVQTGNQYVIGIHSNADYGGDDQCASKTILEDGKQRANKMIASHIPFINGFIDTVMGSTPHHTCRNTSGQFYWCAPKPPGATTPDCRSSCDRSCTSNVQSGTQIDVAGIQACLDACVARCG